jgi:gas vesicle protein
MSEPKRGLLPGLAIGTAVGAIIGILAAPQRGKETRETLRQTIDSLPELTEDLIDEAEIRARQWQEVAAVRWQDTRQRLQAAIVVGIEASQTVWQEGNNLSRRDSAKGDEGTPENE